jgi:hypothetical protein
MRSHSLEDSQNSWNNEEDVDVHGEERAWWCATSCLQTAPLCGGWLVDPSWREMRISRYTPAEGSMSDIRLTA